MSTLRACYLCDRYQERDASEKIPICKNCARIHTIPLPSKEPEESSSYMAYAGIGYDN